MEPQFKEERIYLLSVFCVLASYLFLVVWRNVTFSRLSDSQMRDRRLTWRRTETHESVLMNWPLTDDDVLKLGDQSQTPLYMFGFYKLQFIATVQPHVIITCHVSLLLFFKLPSNLSCFVCFAPAGGQTKCRNFSRESHIKVLHANL